jgi:hypothetical protein
MKTWLFCTLIALGLPGLALAGGGNLVSFNAGIGVTPFENSGTAPSVTVAVNAVHGVNPPGDPWRIGSLFAAVDADGTITVVGTRLLLAGGNGLGSNPVPTVQAKLFCGTSDTAYDSPAVPLDANGNFNISGTLSAEPPDPCTSPVLLIVAAPATGAGPWLAAGIPDNND